MKKSSAFIIILFACLFQSNFTAYSQATYVEINGPATPTINQQVTYSPLFKNQAGNVLAGNEVGIVDIWYGWYVTEEGPGPVASQSNYDLLITWKTLGSCDLELSVVTWDNYLEASPFNLTVVEESAPIPVITSSNNGLLSGSNTVLLSVSNYTYDSYVWLNQDGVAIPGAVNATFSTNQPGLYRVKGIKNGNEFISDLHTISTVEDIANTNSIRTSTTKIRGVTSIENITSLTDLQVITTSDYFDGLGKLMQSVQKRATPDFSDIVTAYSYDEHGRQEKKYLPFVYGTDGSFKFKALGDPGAGLTEANYRSASLQYNFYQNGLGVEHDNFPFSEVQFENSALGRPINEYGPGENWRNNEKKINISYHLNSHGTSSGQEKIIVWTLNNLAQPVRNSDPIYNEGEPYYLTGTLNILVVRDEDGNETREYKTFDGRLILKKVQINKNAASVNNDGHWLHTYYVYDHYGRLAYVLQPKLMESLLLNETDNPDINELAELSFQYMYDARGRQVAKKIPGQAWIYNIYDKRNRLVFTQDGNMRTTHSWKTFVYDELNREVIEGVYKNISLSKTDIQAHVDGLTSSVQNKVFAESSISINVSNYPVPTAGEFTPTVFTYYNTYAFTSKIYQQPAIGSLGIAAEVDLDPVPLTSSVKTTGMLTGKKTRVLSDNINLTNGSWLESVTFYYDNGRLLQVVTDNINGGTDVTTNVFDFEGKIICEHTKISVPLAQQPENIVVTINEYDHWNRPKKIRKKINNTPERIISTFNYDQLGQLISKKVGQKLDETGTPIADTYIEKNEYKYNIRGWIRGVNLDFLDNAANGDNYFGYKLDYESNDVKQLYNGNITFSTWKSFGDKVLREYELSYDAANRLLKADFKQKGPGDNSWSNALVNYNVKLGDGLNSTSAYDANGNILQLEQWGLKTTGSSKVDELAYTYLTNSNKLLKVVDAINIDNKVGDFADGNNTTNDYNYDENGNMTRDLNKDIGTDVLNGVTYNYLNLPQAVTVRHRDNNTVIKGIITYTYDAHGNKLKKTTVENGAQVEGVTTNITTVHSYIGSAVYESKTYDQSSLSSRNYTDKLLFISMEEGRIRADDIINTVSYDYMLKDHLGNVRMVLTDEEKTNYYPAATLEGSFSASGATQALSMVNYEKQFYKIDNDKIKPESSIASWETESTANSKLYYNNNGNPPANLSYPPGTIPTQADGSNNLYELDANNNKTGLEFVMKVMAGDKLNIFGKSYFLNTATVNNANSSALDILNLMTGLLGAPANAIGAKGITAAQLSTINSSLIPPSFIRGNNNEITTIPKAYINYIILDEQFKYVKGGASRVGTSGQVKNHWDTDDILREITIDKNGYIFVYVSNESKLPVYFDNLQVIHKPGPILEETHYYPFGLAMSGISSKAFNGVTENKYRYNGNEEQTGEFNDGSGLELYDFNARTYNAQIGRFIQQDGHAEFYDSWTPYNFSANDPVNISDPTGLDWYKNNKTDEYEWFDGNGEREGYTLMETGKWSDRDSKGFAYFFGEGPDGLIQSGPNDEQTNVAVIGQYKTLDTENGQVYDPLDWWQVVTGWGADREWNGYQVDERGYIRPYPMLILEMPSFGKKSVGKIVTNKWLIYRATKKVNGRLKLYIGKAKNALSKRYTKKQIDEMGAKVIDMLDNIPDNATALGVEQAVLALNGGVKATANIKNAAVKKIYTEAGIKWLNENIPNWKEVFKFQ